MAVRLRKITNPLTHPIVFPSSVICMHWAGCPARATWIMRAFMGSIKVCATHAGE